ncbi:MAG: hypothetical protein B6229_09100, partial [Spirochaetaceae bacterium 4572_7]
MSKLEDEIKTYLEQIEEIIDIDDLAEVNIKKLHNLLTTIIGAVNIGGYSIIGDVVVQLIKVFDGILSNRYDLNHDHITLQLITNEYIKEMISRSPEELKRFSTEGIISAFEDISSELTVDIKDIYIKDIIRDKIRKKIDADILFNDSKDVQIPISRIDSIITGINDLILNQYQLKTKIKEINNIKEIISNIKETGYTAEVDRAIRDFSSTETEIDSQLLKFERTAFNIQEDVLSMRMLPISFIEERIRDTIKTQAARFDKDITAIINMDNILIDKIILQAIEKPIGNIIKNSIEHGIDSSGEITINCSYDKGKINIDISDNGVGVCYKTIRHKAMELFPFEKGKIAKLSDMELTE